MEPSIYRFIFKHSKKQQILLLILTCLSFPVLYMSLELPKLIINEAIDGKPDDFPIEFLGMETDQVSYLLILSCIFLSLVLINGCFKMAINIYKGSLGERMLRRFRYDLYIRILRFPISRFRKVSPGELIPMVTAEAEPFGGFIGDAIVLPVFQGGILLVYISFIFMQDPYLGAAALAFYPLQGWLIPKLQRRVNELGKQRVKAARHLSDRINETVLGVEEIHANNMARWHLADFSHRLGHIFEIRFALYKRKFFVKFLNNFINQLTPFFFYAIGGYFVIKGEISFGALVAVLAAYKDLASPWRELLNFYQQKEDIRIKYDQVIEQFQPAGMSSVERLTEEATLPEASQNGPLKLVNLGYEVDEGNPILSNLNVELPLDKSIAVVSGGNSGRDQMLKLSAGLLEATSGSVLLGDTDLANMPESVLGRFFCYIGPSAHVFTGTIRENLLYGLQQRPLNLPAYEGEDLKEYERRCELARWSGNSEDDVLADWVDYKTAGVKDLEALEDRIQHLLVSVGLDEDIYQFGLKTQTSFNGCHIFAAKLLEARELVRQRLAEPEFDDLVETFDRRAYNENATVTENLLFGTPTDKALSNEHLLQHDHLRQILDRTGLTEIFLELGIELANTMVELFADLPPGHEFFSRYSFISAEELPDYQGILNRLQGEEIYELNEEEQSKLTALTLRLIPARHRLGLLTAEIKDQIVKARRMFRKTLPQDQQEQIIFFDKDTLNPSVTIQDNILFGRVTHGRPNAVERVGEVISSVINQMKLREDVTKVGLSFEVGIAGSVLTAPQRQKLALVRGLLKNPKLLVLSEFTASMDSASRMCLCHNILKERQGKGLVWAVQDPKMAENFEHILVLEDGKIVEQGSYQDLAARQAAFVRIVAAGGIAG